MTLTVSKTNELTLHLINSLTLLLSSNEASIPTVSPKEDPIFLRIFGCISSGGTVCRVIQVGIIKSRFSSLQSETHSKNLNTYPLKKHSDNCINFFFISSFELCKYTILLVK